MSKFDNIVVSKVQSKSVILPCKQDGFDFVINPYTGCPNPCKYCYASFMRRFSKHSEQWGEFLDVKDCEHLDTKKLIEKNLMIGSVTEPYNFFEKKFKLMRQILKQLESVDCNVTIFTKSNLVLRDLDLLKRLKNVKVAISLSTLDEGVAHGIEQSYSVADRLNALEKLHSGGIKTVVDISPIIPFLTDPIEIIQKARAFADEYIFENLTLRNEFKPAMLNYIWANFPQYFKDYNHIYRDSDYSIFKEISKNLTEFCDKNHIKYTNLIKF